ncbi:MAG: homoserine O-acetyltransferase [Flavobacteriales bacterium]
MIDILEKSATIPLRTFVTRHPFALEAGGVLRGARVAYRTWGELNAAGDNVVWVLHALTGDTDAASWWPALIGPGRPADPRKHFIVCANMVGSCYGSTGPLTTDPGTGSPYYGTFPLLTQGDIVWFFRSLREHLGVQRIALLIGGSTGGQQALEWAFQEPERIGRLVVVAANARHSPWGIAFNEAQRMALEADPTFGEARPDAGSAGLAAARAMAVLTYRSAASINQYQHDADRGYDRFKAAGYMRHQGNKLVQRFNAHSYHVLTRAMDSHDVGRGRGGTNVALSSLRIPTLSIGVSSRSAVPAAGPALYRRARAGRGVPRDREPPRSRCLPAGTGKTGGHPGRRTDRTLNDNPPNNDH